MRKFILIASLFIAIASTGCSKNLSDHGVYQKSGNTLNVNTNRTDLYNDRGAQSIRNVSNNYGFVRHQKSPIMNGKENKHYTAIDREQLANIISKYCTNIPNVNDVATLVTDREVLISYLTDTRNRNKTADQVKKTAMSVIPRYYHVYVTDDKHLMRDVENLSHLDSTSRNARNLVNHLVSQMKKSPQGKPMNASENANGETSDDKMGQPNQ